MADDTPTSFTQMRDATREDYQRIARHNAEFCKGLPDRVLAHLEILSTDTGGYAVDRLTHSLQTATRARRDGQDDEYVVCALLHDIGDTLASANHADLAAAILKPFVGEKNLWIVEHHALFQGYYYFHHFDLDRHARDRLRDHPWFGDCAAFCEKYDQNSFDRDYDTLPLAAFEPAVRAVLSAPANAYQLTGEREAALRR